MFTEVLHTRLRPCVAAALLALAFPGFSAKAASPSPYAQTAPLALAGVTAGAKSVPKYGKIELSVDLHATYDNPFDPEQIDLGADFMGPGGRKVHVNGFFFQDFTRTLEDGKYEKFHPEGATGWRIRFAPDRVGAWTFVVSAHDRSGTVRSQPGRFTATPSADPGFIQVSKKNPRAFAFDAERPYFPVGENMDWGGNRGTYDYEVWVPKLHAVGGNWVRLWMNSWNTGLEWTPQGDNAAITGFHGLGVYNLEHAWKLDKTLDILEQNRVYALLCFGTYGEFTKGGTFNEGEWDKNPYNAANGGPCAMPADFWTNAEARKLYRQRLRYIGARYGYRTSIQSWELWNESDAPAPWIAEMAQCLKGTKAFAGHPADPYHHLVSTTNGYAAVWKIPEIEWTQSHLYGTGDIPDFSAPIASDAAKNAVYGKPHLMAEFGIDYRKTDMDYDPKGRAVNFHNGLWSAAASGDAGGAMLWYWDNYIEPLNLYGTLTGLAKTAARIPWTAGPWKPVAGGAVIVPTKTASYGDMLLTSSTQWGKAAEDEFTIDAANPGSSQSYPTYFYSPGKPDLRSVHRFHVDYPVAGQFIAHVDTVSSWAVLQIQVDGKDAKTFRFDASPPKTGTPGYKSTTFNEQYKIFVAQFDTECAVDVPPGKHTVTVSATDGDWLTIGSYRLTQYRSGSYANAMLMGTMHGSDALIWIHNLDDTWKQAAAGNPVPSIAGAQTVLRGFPAGRYSIAWTDTHTGAVLRTDRVTSKKADDFGLHIPKFQGDIAAVIKADR